VIDDAFLSLCVKEHGSLVDLLKTLVALPSPSGSKALVDQVTDFVGTWLGRNSFSPHIEKRTSVGDLVWAEWRPQAPEGRILVLCHLDTVWPADAEERNPFRIEEDRIYGPGIFDMKAGVALTLKVQELLSRQMIRPRRAVRFLYTTDEETGGFESRELIEDFARQSDLVLVTEPALPGGGLKTFRKGSGMYEIEVLGRSAHAGLEPEKGVNAIEELARQVTEMKALEDLEQGTTVTFTLVRGGTASNVVPDRACASIDVRFRASQEGDRVDSALKQRRALKQGAQVKVTGCLDRPPMVRSPKTAELFRAAQEIARTLGIELWEGEAGGGSDGNFTAALGIPTLDGLGVEGAGAHTPDEYVLRSSLVPRLALLARLIERL